MNKRQRKKKYPKSCVKCSMMELIKSKGLISNNGCIGCPHKIVADEEVEKNYKLLEKCTYIVKELKWSNGKEWGEIFCPMLQRAVMTYWEEGTP